MDVSMLILALVFLTTVGATLSSFKTVKAIIEKEIWQPWAVFTGVLIFAVAMGLWLPFAL